MLPNLPRVCVIVLNWNGKRHLDYALPSILATDYPNYEVVVVDNASTDDSVQFIRQFPAITLIQNPTNLQFAAGNNVGLRYALERDFRYVALLNNDIKVDPRWLAAAVEAAEARPTVGAVGFRVFNEYRVEDPDACKFEAARSEWQTLQVTPTKGIAGCALFMPVALLRRIGLFDATFIAYAEEDDLEKRTVEAGYELVRTNVPIWHFSMGSWGKMPVQSSRLAIRNTLRCAIKHERPREVWRTFRLLYDVSVNPFTKVDPASYHYRRLRPQSRLLGARLLTSAVAWNLWHLRETLAITREERRRLAAFVAGAGPQ